MPRHYRYADCAIFYAMPMPLLSTLYFSDVANIRCFLPSIPSIICTLDDSGGGRRQERLPSFIFSHCLRLRLMVDAPVYAPRVDVARLADHHAIMAMCSAMLLATPSP